jgi:hypothetical protein
VNLACNHLVNKNWLFSSIIFILIFIPYSVFSSDFNINIRKTDINDLKDQIISPIDKNIVFLNDLYICLQNKKAIEFCVEAYVDKLSQIYTKEESISKDVLLKKDQIRNDLKNKISDGDRSDIIEKLKQLITEIKSIKICIRKAQIANDIKDCILLGKRS